MAGSPHINWESRNPNLRKLCHYFSVGFSVIIKSSPNSLNLNFLISKIKVFYVLSKALQILINRQTNK